MIYVGSPKTENPAMRVPIGGSVYSDVINGTGISVSFHLAPTLVYLLRDYSNRVVPDLHSLRRQLDAKNDQLGPYQT